jgi:hypothetical protein
VRIYIPFSPNVGPFSTGAIFEEVLREAHRLSLLVYLWCLGHIMPLVPDIRQLGVDIV